MKIKYRGKRKPAFPWAERHWKGYDCGTVVYLEEGDAVEYRDDPHALPYEDGRTVNILCPVCNRQETYTPTVDPDPPTYR